MFQQKRRRFCKTLSSDVSNKVPPEKIAQVHINITKFLILIIKNKKNRLRYEDRERNVI